MSSYTQTGDKLKFGMGAGTLMACPPDFMQIESSMHKAMAETTAFTIDAEILQLKSSEGALLAVFDRSAQ